MWGRRSPVVFLMTALAVPSLFMFNESPDNQTAAASLMCLSGFFIGTFQNTFPAFLSYILNVILNFRWC